MPWGWYFDGVSPICGLSADPLATLKGASGSRHSPSMPLQWNGVTGCLPSPN